MLKIYNRSYGVIFLWQRVENICKKKHLYSFTTITTNNFYINIENRPKKLIFNVKEKKQGFCLHIRKNNI